MVASVIGAGCSVQLDDSYKLSCFGFWLYSEWNCRKKDKGVVCSGSATVKYLSKPAHALCRQKWTSIDFAMICSMGCLEHMLICTSDMGVWCINLGEEVTINRQVMGHKGDFNQVYLILNCLWGMNIPAFKLHCLGSGCWMLNCMVVHDKDAICMAVWQCTS
jgi:hypothetical protein